MTTKKHHTFRLLIASAIIIPTILFFFTIWQDYNSILAANNIELVRTSRTFKQHAMNVFETHELIADRINERLKGMAWDDIARSGELQPFLRAIVKQYPQAQAIWLADASGRVRAGSESLPAGSVSVADRDYFLGLSRHDSGIYIGHVVKPRVIKNLNFNIACRRWNPAGTFDGVIIVTVFPEYFSNFWSKVTSRQDCAVALLRADGAVLARMPRLDPEHLLLPAGSVQMKELRKADQGTFTTVAVNDGVERTYAFTKLDKYNAYVLYGANLQSALRSWLRHVLYYGGLFGIAMATLLWFSLAASRFSQREQAAREALQESEERLRLLGDNLPDSAVYQYVHESGAVRFSYFSRGIERLNGIAVPEVLRDAAVLHRQIPQPYFQQLVQAEAASARGLTDFAMEVPMRRADGELRWMQLHSRPRVLADGGVVWDGVQTDVTARKQAEEALRRLNEELDSRVAERTLELREKDQLMIQQSRQAAMGEMIHNIAHQWRQPLNSLGLIIQRLQMFHEMGEFSPELLDKSVSDSMRLIRHMSKTIDDFKDYFKPNKAIEEFTVSGAIGQTLQLIKASFDNSHIRIDYHCAEDFVICGYPNEYAQVILNILGNAKDALVAARTEDPAVVIAACVEGGRSVVTIRDNAGGIPEGILPKVFDPHFTTKGPQGTGIGLFMAKTIIERSMNGRLSVRNSDAGAEFRIEV
jgi:PAS domain S-box-containing protein